MLSARDFYASLAPLIDSSVKHPAKHKLHCKVKGFYECTTRTRLSQRITYLFHEHIAKSVFDKEPFVLSSSKFGRIGLNAIKCNTSHMSHC